MAELSCTTVDTTYHEDSLELCSNGGPEYKALLVIQEAKGMRNREVSGWNDKLEGQDC